MDADSSEGATRGTASDDQRDIVHAVACDVHPLRGLQAKTSLQVVGHATHALIPVYTGCSEGVPEKRQVMLGGTCGKLASAELWCRTSLPARDGRRNDNSTRAGCGTDTGVRLVSGCKRPGGGHAPLPRRGRGSTAWAGRFADTEVVPVSRSAQPAGDHTSLLGAPRRLVCRPRRASPSA